MELKPWDKAIVSLSLHIIMIGKMCPLYNVISMMIVILESSVSCILEASVCQIIFTNMGMWLVSAC